MGGGEGSGEVREVGAGGLCEGGGGGVGVMFSILFGFHEAV